MTKLDRWGGCIVLAIVMAAFALLALFAPTNSNSPPVLKALVSETAEAHPPARARAARVARQAIKDEGGKIEAWLGQFNRTSHSRRFSALLENDELWCARISHTYRVMHVWLCGGLGGGVFDESPARLAQAPPENPGSAFGRCQSTAARNSAPSVPARPGEFGICPLPIATASRVRINLDRVIARTIKYAERECKKSNFDPVVKCTGWDAQQCFVLAPTFPDRATCGAAFVIETMLRRPGSRISLYCWQELWFKAVKRDPNNIRIYDRKPKKDFKCEEVGDLG